MNNTFDRLRAEKFNKLEAEAAKIKQNLLGKTIQDVNITVSRYPGQFEGIDITFTDGQKISIGSGGSCGCADSDGFGYGISID